MDAPAKCRDCGAMIVWAEKPGGGRVPLDWPPDPVGNCVVDAGGSLGPMNDGDLADLTVRYTRHWARCQKRR